MIHRLPAHRIAPWRIGFVVVNVCALLVAVAVWRQPFQATVDATAAPNASKVTLAMRKVSATEAESANVASKAPSPAKQRPEELELVHQIRQQLGSPLDSSMFQDADAEQDAFDATYLRQAAASEENVAADDIERSQTSPWDPVQDPQTAYQSALRDAARALDAAAADLEETAAYNRADDLRNWAARLRSDAR